MKVVQSQFQLEEFNSCVPECVKDAINKVLPFKVNFVDVLDERYWKNCDDTMVIEIDMSKVKKENMNEFALFVIDIGADEYDYMDEGNGKFVYRFWWD